MRRQRREQLLRPGQARLRRRSAVRLRPALQGLLQRRPLGVLGNRTTTGSPSAALFRPGRSRPDLPLPTATPASRRPGPSRPTTTWILASCRENMQYFSVSGRAAWYGPKGDANEPALPFGRTVVYRDRDRFNCEPIRLTFDASKAFWGRSILTSSTSGSPTATGRTSSASTTTRRPASARLRRPASSTNSCTESSLYSGVTVKF